MRRYGIEPASARGQAQRDQRTGVKEPFQPLPAPTGKAPYRMALEDALMDGEAANESLTFFVVGDTGGVKDPKPQLEVAAAMIDAAPSAGAELVYHLGDISYFNGAEVEYGPQFYEAYAHLNLPIVGIPGNHDGDPEDDGEPSLQAFMENMCSSAPALPEKWAEFNRDTMTQPNCYWTATHELVTIIGLYTNVPSGGEIYPDQLAWFIGELEAAPTDRALIVALHHPPLSCDAHHGGSERMGNLLTTAFNEAGRFPDLVLSGHVHNYQRFGVRHEGSGSKTVPYIVCGAGGYHNLHAMAADAQPGMEIVPGVSLAAFDAVEWGFLDLTVSATEIVGNYTGVNAEGDAAAGIDSFRVPVGA